MEFSAKLTKQDLEDLAILMRPRFYWVRVLLENLRGTALIAALIWIGVLGLIGRSDLDWRIVAAVWALLVGVFGWGFYSAQCEQAKTLAAVNAAIPDRTTFAHDGVRWNSAGGESGFLPWSHFTAFRERGGVLALDQATRKTSVFLSVRHLSEIERQQLRDFLHSQIPPGRPDGRRIQPNAHLT